MPNKTFFVVLLIWCTVLPAFSQETSNTITRNEFNFGHQVGYMYARMDDAYFGTRGTWTFETGGAVLYTSEMPRVRSSRWRERSFIYIPLYFELFPSDNVAIQVELTDLFVERPYYDIHSMGGKSPRIRTKLRLLKEGENLPAVAFTAGVKFSSAKPWVIWRNDHNYDESNGLTGAGTGVADYLLLFTLSKTFGTTSLHTHFGLAPVGSPVEYKRGSAQADELPYGISMRHNFTDEWSGRVEIAGMYNGLSSTELAHYSVARLRINRAFGHNLLIFNVEHGLTEESDEWGAGVFVKFMFGKKR
jgi:hypothetical protein